MAQVGGVRFTQAERRWLVEAFEAVLPAEVAEVPLAGFVAELARVAPARVSWGLRGVRIFVLFRAVAAGTPWGRRSPGSRAALLEGMRGSEIYLVREVPLLLKAVAAFAAFGHPLGQAAMGLPADDGPPGWAR